MLFRCAGITDSCIDGLEYSPSICIFFSGCSLNCPGCQNPELQDFNFGESIETDDVIDTINKYKDFYKGVTFTGGNPTESPDELYEIASKCDLPKILYTGNTYNEIPEPLRSLFDIIVDGRYVAELATGSFPASSNQNVIRRTI